MRDKLSTTFLQEKTSGISLPVCATIRNRRLYTFPRHNKKGSRRWVDSGEGCPFPLIQLRRRYYPIMRLLEQSLLFGNPPSIQLNSPTELRVTKRAVGTHDKDEGVGGNSYFRSHRSCCRIRATQDFRRGLRWMPPCRVLSFSAGTTETKIMTSQCESQTEILLLGRAKE
jgi:hypothetical protein